MKVAKAEYIWIDGSSPTQKLRSKTRIIPVVPDHMTGLLKLEARYTDVNQFPEWGFDGSSTGQSEGDNSDLILKPVRFVKDPLSSNDGDYLVLCEVLNTDKDRSPHVSNTRAELRAVLDAGADESDAWFGFEQEYTLLNEQGRPLGWPDNPRDFPAPQGGFYCGVGADEVFGRDLVETHLQACMDASLLIYGINAEVMAGQWEFQIGFRPGIDNKVDPLQVSDHLWIARWLLYRIGETYKVSATLDPKPIVSGDWNGSGLHTNFSTRDMRDPATGKQTMSEMRIQLEAKHKEHVACYGVGNNQRLTGLHETCDINTFKMGARDRGASIRIPDNVARDGFGYLEDRRPAANADPYQVSGRLLKTILDME